MKTVLLLSVFALFPGGERERGLQLYREGKFAEAVAAFRAAVEQDGDSAELQWNLALAAWRAGDLPTAETAAEKYAALDKNARVDLHAGMLGAVRHDEAMALDAKAAALQQAPPPPPPAAAGGTEPPPPEDPLPVLEQALAKATQARDYFVRGAAAKPTAELLRNTERSLRTIDELQKKIDELKKQREPQKDDQKQDDKKDKDDKDEKQKDEQDNKDKKDQKGEEPKPEEQSEPKPEEQKPEEQKPEEQKPGESKPEQGEGEEKPEPKPGEPKPEEQPPDEKTSEPKPEPKPGEKRQDAPGEQAEAKELTPEQLQRLLEKLRDLDDKQKQIRARAKAGRRPVERDW